MTTDEIGARAAERIAAMRVPCAAIQLGGAPASATSSYLAGHPYLPPGAEWPADADGPMAFVAQVNFAEVPREVVEATGLPGSGLLQWFVGDTDTLGLTFDETQGTTGFAVRWHPDPAAAPSTREPHEPPPPTEDFPLDATTATAMTFTVAHDVPGWADLPDDVRADAVWAELATAHGESAEDVEFTYEEHVRADAPDSKIGGYPAFTQDDPRGDAGYPPIGDPAARLLIQLDSNQTGGWGDAGIAQLFADLGAIARGDVSSVRYHWDCA